MYIFPWLNHILGYLNDLWMFNVSSGWWTWLSGSNLTNPKGFYGAQGLESANNQPGGRDSLTMAMHPSGQSIYVFGGHGLGADYSGP